MAVFYFEVMFENHYSLKKKYVISPEVRRSAKRYLDMDLEAWYLDSNEDDQRKPHRQNPNQPVSMEQLKTLGVFYWKVTGVF